MAGAPEAATAKGIEWMDTCLLGVAKRAGPPVEASAHAGRSARAVAVASRVALRLRAVVPTPPDFAHALAGALAAAVSRAATRATRLAARRAGVALKAPALPGRVAAAVARAVVQASGRRAVGAAPAICALAQARRGTRTAAVGLAASRHAAVGGSAGVALPASHALALIRCDA